MSIRTINTIPTKTIKTCHFTYKCTLLSALDLSSLLPSIEKRVNVLDKCFKNKNLKIKIYFYSTFSTTISFSITDPFVFDAVFSERTIKNI